MDRAFIIREIACSISGGSRRFAQHIITVGEALLLLLPGTAQRPANGFADDELFTHQLHRQINPAPDHRFAQAGYDPAQGSAKPRCGAIAHQLASDHQPPCRSIDE